MVPLLAWRNIWRNPVRSLVVIFAIALGIWADLFMTAFATGMVEHYVETTISRVVSHIQIHRPDYQKDRDVRFVVEDLPAVSTLLMKNPAVVAFSPRTLANGMISSAKGSRGVQIKGVVPSREAAVSKLQEQIIEGEYFEKNKKNQILLGKALAEKLQVKLRSKIVLTFQDLEGNITTAAFRIAGIFASGNTPYEEMNVFVPQDELSALLVAGGSASVHEIAVICRSTTDMPIVQRALQQAFPGLLVENYREIAPDLQLYESQIEYVSLIYLVIILLALVFGIINTMLMAVLERFRELGMLMAIGMNKARVFGMIMLETLLISLIGAPLGLLLGRLTIHYFSIHPLDLSRFAKSLNEYGMGTEVYFHTDTATYWQAALLLLVTALLASVYPALKATRMKPVEAIRKI
jgi:ABC-type lipoprotein release transport system permease subunit